MYYAAPRVGRALLGSARRCVMTEFRNVQADLTRFRARVLTVTVLMLVLFVMLALRLVYLQVLRHEDLNEQAENNTRPSCPWCPTGG